MAISDFSVRHQRKNKRTGQIVLTETRWGSYSSSLTCTQQEVAFLGLSNDQKLAATITTQPTPAEGTHLELRTCTGTALPDVYLTCSRDDFTPNDAPPPISQNYDSDGALGGHFVV